MQPDYKSNNLMLRQFFHQGMIYLVTEQSLSNGRNSEDIAGQALANGIKMIQMREKNLSKAQRLGLAHKLRTMTRAHNALLFINDDVDIALLSQADGVHLGLDDLPIDEVKAAFPQLLVGASTHNESEALQALAQEADYINIGPIYPTKTKDWQDLYLGTDGLAQIYELLAQNHPTLPVFTVMGGIKCDNIPALARSGARICAMVTEITQATDPGQQAKILLEQLKKNIK